MTNHDRNEILDVAHLSVLIDALGPLAGVISGVFFIGYFGMYILIGLLAFLSILF
jgi:Co/Zn/Cd efflux system component